MIDFSILQNNPKMGDLKNNSQQIAEAFFKRTSHLLVTPELSISGSMCNDLLLNNNFLDCINEQIEMLAQLTTNKSAILVGAPIKKDNKILNSLLFLYKGEVKLQHYKNNLCPIQDNYFSTTQSNRQIIFNEQKIDLAFSNDLLKYNNISNHQDDNDAIIIVGNDRYKISDNTINNIKAKKAIYVNRCGSHDHIVFNGSSRLIDCSGAIQYLSPAWQSDILHMNDIEISNLIATNQNNANNNITEKTIKSIQSIDETILIAPHKYKLEQKYHALIQNKCIDNNNQYEKSFKLILQNQSSDQKYYNIYHAIITTIQNYFNNNNFTKAIIGISGGIDSALCSALLVTALGRQNVTGIMMPSPYTSTESIDYAKNLAKNLQINYKIIPINDSIDHLVNLLDIDTKNIAYQNIQARLRGVILMTLSNQNNALLVATGNKSEIATGYATLYGDTCGAIAILADLYKTEVFALAKWYNQHIANLIPNTIINRPPSAELQNDQYDENELGKYELLDKILYKIINQNQSATTIANDLNIPVKQVNKIFALIKKSTYKRLQLPMIIKLSDTSFNIDKKTSITNLFQTHD